MARANKRTAHLDDNKIRAKYLKGATLAELAEEFGVSTGTIRGRVGDIARKSVTEVLPRKQELIEEIKKEGGMRAVAEKYGISYGSMATHCNRVGISIKGELRKKRKKIIHEDNKEIASDYLSGMPVAEMMEKYGLSRQGIYNRLTEEGVERRGHLQREYKKKKELFEDVSAGLTATEIAKKHGICVATVRRLTDNYGLVISKHTKSLGFDSQELIEKYESGKSLNELAREYDTCAMTIRRYILAGGGKTRPAGRRYRHEEI